LDRLVAVADALADLSYVLAGTALHYGIPLDEVTAEVHRSNMAKAEECPCVAWGGYPKADCEGCGGKGWVVLRRDDGKILKPDGWRPPDIRGIIARALRRAEEERERREKDAHLAKMEALRERGARVPTAPVPLPGGDYARCPACGGNWGPHGFGPLEVQRGDRLTCLRCGTCFYYEDDEPPEDALHHHRVMTAEPVDPEQPDGPWHGRSVDVDFKVAVVGAEEAADQIARYQEMFEAGYREMCEAAWKGKKPVHTPASRAFLAEAERALRRLTSPEETEPTLREIVAVAERLGLRVTSATSARYDMPEECGPLPREDVRCAAEDGELPEPGTEGP
jgi:hypothetical protein